MQKKKRNVRPGAGAAPDEWPVFETVTDGPHRVCVARPEDGSLSTCLSHLAAAGFGGPVNLNKATERYGRDGTLRMLQMPASGGGSIKAWFCTREFLTEWLSRLEAQKSMPSMQHDLDGVAARADGVSGCIGVYDRVVSKLSMRRSEDDILALMGEPAPRDIAAILDGPLPARARDLDARMAALAMLLGVFENGTAPVYSVVAEALGGTYRHVERVDWVSFFTEFRDRYPGSGLDPAYLAEQCAAVWDFTGRRPNGCMSAERLFVNAVRRP